METKISIPKLSLRGEYNNTTQDSEKPSAQINLLSNYLNALKKGFDFSGTTSIGEYWRFFWMNILISSLIGIVVSYEFLIFGPPYLNVINILYVIILFIPSIAIGVRRMHDVGKSGWLILVPIYNIVLLATKGKNYNTNHKGFTSKYVFLIIVAVAAYIALFFVQMDVIQFQYLLSNDKYGTLEETIPMTGQKCESIVYRIK